jgi:hypothetical protein
MQVYSFGRISSRMSLNSPASFDLKLQLDPNITMIFGLKLSMSDISDPYRTYLTRDSFDLKNHRSCGFFFRLFLLSHTSLSCISRPCLTLPPVSAVEKRTKKTQDVGRASAQANKPRVWKVTLHVPSLVPSDEEEEELPL